MGKKRRGKPPALLRLLKSALGDERPGGIHASRVVPSRGDDARFGAAVDFVHADLRPGVHARERLVVEHARGRQAEGDAGAFERRVEHPHEGGRRHERDGTVEFEKLFLIDRAGVGDGRARRHRHPDGEGEAVEMPRIHRGGDHGALEMTAEKPLRDHGLAAHEADGLFNALGRARRARREEYERPFRLGRPEFGSRARILGEVRGERGLRERPMRLRREDGVVFVCERLVHGAAARKEHGYAVPPEDGREEHREVVRRIGVNGDARARRHVCECGGSGRDPARQFGAGRHGTVRMDCGGRLRAAFEPACDGRALGIRHA